MIAIMLLLTERLKDIEGRSIMRHDHAFLLSVLLGFQDE